MFWKQLCHHIAFHGHQNSKPQWYRVKEKRSHLSLSLKPLIRILDGTVNIPKVYECYSSTLGLKINKKPSRVLELHCLRLWGMGRWTSSGWQEGYIFFFFLHFPETGFALVEFHCRQENIKWIFKLSKRILHCWRHTAPHETKGLIQANILFQRPPTPPPQEWRKENLNKNQTGGHLSPECHFPNNTNIKYWLLNRTITLGNEKKKNPKKCTSKPYHNPMRSLSNQTLVSLPGQSAAQDTQKPKKIRCSILPPSRNRLIYIYKEIQ